MQLAVPAALGVRLETECFGEGRPTDRPGVIYALLTLCRPHGDRVKTTQGAAINEDVPGETVTDKNVINSLAIGRRGKHCNRPLTTDGLTNAHLIFRVLQSSEAHSQPRPGSGLDGQRGNRIPQARELDAQAVHAVKSIGIARERRRGRPADHGPVDGVS